MRRFSVLQISKREVILDNKEIPLFALVLQGLKDIILSCTFDGIVKA
jgi:hypothetical protein